MLCGWYAFDRKAFLFFLQSTDFSSRIEFRRDTSCMVGCLSLIWSCSLVSNLVILQNWQNFIKWSRRNKTRMWQISDYEQPAEVLIDVMYTICSANDTTPADWNHLMFNSSLTFYHHVRYVFHDFCIFYFTPKFLATDRTMMLLSVLNILHSSSGNNSTKVD